MMKEKINKIKNKINKIKYKLRYKLIYNRELSFYVYLITCQITLIYKYVVMWGEPLVIETYLLDGGMATIRILMAIVSLGCMLYVIRHITPMVGWYGVVFRVVFSLWKICFWVPMLPADGVLEKSLQGLFVLKYGGFAEKVEDLPNGVDLSDNYLETFRDLIGGF
jgi:hypothetical protein